ATNAATPTIARPATTAPATTPNPPATRTPAPGLRRQGDPLRSRLLGLHSPPGCTRSGGPSNHEHWRGQEVAPDGVAPASPDSSRRIFHDAYGQTSATSRASDSASNGRPRCTSPATRVGVPALGSIETPPVAPPAGTAPSGAVIVSGWSNLL